MANIGSYPLNEIITGDSRLLAQSIPDESIDLIFTDPIYENIEDYEWLARIAARILKPDRACLAWTSTTYLPECINAMTPHLKWAWLLYWQRIANYAIYPGRTGITVVTPCMWFEKGHSKTIGKIADLKSSPLNAKSQHKWSKPIEVLSKWLYAFVRPGMIVYDPFAGSGSISYVCKRFEIDFIASETLPETADIARSRLLQTDIPLGLAKPNNRLHLDVGDSPAQQALFTPEADTAEGKLPAPAPRR